MLRRHYKIILRCLVILPLICLLDVLGVFTHIFELDYERHFHYPLVRQQQQHDDSETIDATTTVPTNIAFNYSFLREPRSGATDTPRLTLLIKSATGNVKRRQAIRQTWGYENRFSDVHIKRVFLLGLPSMLDEERRTAIAKEAVQQGDIMQANFEDAYFNNTLKTMMGIRWASEHYNNSDYYMFVDDDYYVSLKNVLRFLGNGRGRHTQSSANLFAGYVIQSSPLRHKFSKWYISLEEYPFDKWPPYVTAGAFILSREALLKLWTVSRRVPLFRFDDVYLGIVALKANIKLQHCDRFYFNRPRYKGPDSYSGVIASHEFDEPVEMERIWNECRSANYA